MKVLIAGCGYVGEELGRQLAAEGHTVWGLRRSPHGLDPAIRPVRADLLDPQLARLLPPSDTVVFAASANESSEEGYRRIYVDGVRNVLSALRDRDVQRFLFVSSTAVYGDTGGETVDEATPANPENFRGATMLEGERAVLGDGIPATILRLGGIYGPERTRLLERVREGRARCPWGAPVWSNRIHRDDAAGAILHLLSLRDPAPIYLGVDREPTPLCTVYRELARLLDAPEPGMDAPEATRRRGNKRCSSRKLQESGYRFRFPTFREGYGGMIAAGSPDRRHTSS